MSLISSTDDIKRYMMIFRRIIHCSDLTNKNRFYIKSAYRFCPWYMLVSISSTSSFLTPTTSCSTHSKNVLKLLFPVHVSDTRILFIKNLLDTDFLIMKVTMRFISIRKQRFYWCLKQCKELHQKSALELKTLDINWGHRKNLCG